MRRYTFYLSVALLAFGVGSMNGFCQRQISKEDYYQSFRAASKQRFETSRREISQLKDYKDGELINTTEAVDEYLIPDKYHRTSTRIFNDRIEKSEFISINKTYYCRKNDADWEQSSKGCIFGSGSGGPSNIVNSKYTVEEAKINNQKVNLYQEYTTYKNIYSPSKDKEGLSYWQQKMWVSKDGFILREETEVGLLEPKRRYWQKTTAYEYNPKNLKIEAPIK